VLGIFSVETIGSTVRTDRINIMFEFVKFVDIKMFADFELEKDGLFLMEGSPCSIKPGKGFVAVVSKWA
jgi:hypothetical protein